MPTPLQEQRLFDGLLEARETFQQIASTNLTLVGIAAGSLLLKSIDAKPASVIGISVISICLGVFAFIYTGHVCRKFETTRKCISAMEVKSREDLKPLGLDGSSLLVVARSVRRSAFGVFGAAYIVLLTTWTAVICPDTNYMSIWQVVSSPEFTFLCLGLLVPYAVAHAGLACLHCPLPVAFHIPDEE